MRTAKELDPTIRAWWEAMGFYRIPWKCYKGLYRRALDVRRLAMQRGDREPPMIDAALMIAQWTGPHGLEAEIKQREVDAGKFLPENAESVCRHCHGSGFRKLTDGRDAVVKCDHVN